MAETRLFPLPGGHPRDPDVNPWFESQPSELASTARRWFEEMRICGPEVTDLLHNGHPTACVGELAFGYVDAFKNHVNVGLFPGTSREDPERLIQGTGRFMRHVKLMPSQPTDEASLRNLIGCAYSDMRALLETNRRKRGYAREASQLAQADCCELARCKPILIVAAPAQLKR